MAKGYMHRQGLNLHNTFASIAKAASVQTLLAFAAVKDLEIEQINLKMAFLHRQLEEEVYVEQPTRYVQGLGLVF